MKSRGVKGKLSKMRKHELQELVRQSAPADKREPTGIMLEPDEQAGGHYFNKKGETKSDGAHEHRTDPWPVTEKAKPKKKAPPKKYNAVTDPKAKLTGKLVTQRLNERRHPATGKKLQPREGKSASNIAEAMRSIISANPIGASEIKDSDLERMQNIDQEAQDYLRSPAEVAQWISGIA